MKTLKTRPKHSIINVRVLILTYLLLTVLTIVFYRSFMSGLLESGEIPGFLNMTAFFIISGVMLVILVNSIAGITGNFLGQVSGSRFQIRLLGYFFIVVILAAAPVTLITSLSVTGLIRFWKTIDIDVAMDHAQYFAVKSYSLNLEKLEKITEETNFNTIMAGRAELPAGIMGVQDFAFRDAVWVDSGYAGNETLRLGDLPSRQRGFIPRELPRDVNVIRYVTLPGPNLVRLITLDLGEDFDAALRTIDNERARFGVINSMQLNINRLLIFYYGVFFLPALLMTLVIALSFTRQIASPIEELTEATKRVADGDFSIRILPRRGDELALLVQSFNAMVGDLEKSRTALLKTEKITLWQDMAQRLAHEIKNPLTPILLSAERVLRRWRNDPERIADILENSMLAIIQEVEGLSTLLGDFRTLARPMEPSETWIELKELVEEFIKPFYSSHPHVRFDTGNLGSGITLKIDNHRLSQILSNLIINGIDAMDGSGLIEIRSDLVKKQESSYCRLSIRDTGKGISKEDAPQVFMPYFTTKESGTGLGLPIIERIVNDHGGTIWFDSAEGAGTTFYIDLPMENEI
jgi:nitrogen fixation/metabolism regulation signal transduction histidine kinase